MDLFASTAFDSRVDDLIKRYHIPGLAIALTHHDATACKAFGIVSDDPPVPMSADTLFDIASASKSLTAASVALLVADNDQYPEVQYDAEMATLLPEDFVMPGHDHHGVTVDDILGHRSGMASNDNSYLGVRAERPDDARSVTRSLRHLDTGAPLRSKFIYCNIMYTVATHLVEQKTGSSFADFLDDKFFAPLGMTATNLQPARARARGLGHLISPGYSWDRESQTYRQKFDIPDAPEAQGAGSVITSVRDYIKYVRAVMHKQAPFTEDVYAGLVRARTVVEPDHYTDERRLPFTSPPLYAAGWEIHHYRGYQIVVHDGGITGSSSTHFFLPELKFGGVMFGNTDMAALVAQILKYELIDHILRSGSSPDTATITNPPQPSLPSQTNWERVLFESWYEGKFEDRDNEDVWEQMEERCVEDMRQKLLSSGPGTGTREGAGQEQQEKPLEVYLGEYWHPGWHSLHVQNANGKLFIDCTDRSYVFTLTLVHVCDQTKYYARYKEVTAGYGAPLAIEFRFDDEAGEEEGGGLAVKLGVAFDEDLDDHVWFERVRPASAVQMAIRSKEGES